MRMQIEGWLGSEDYSRDDELMKSGKDLRRLNSKGWISLRRFTKSFEK